MRRRGGEEEGREGEGREEGREEEGREEGELRKVFSH